MENKNDELIRKKAAQHKINAIIDEFETIMKDIRERHVDDSVCGLCEYDGAYMGQSGNWCNECPGFERDDCFKLKDQYREEWAGAIKNLPPVNGDLIKKIEEGIKATGTADVYSVGMCNGMKWCKSLLDGKEPEYDIVQPRYKKRRG